ncbi:MAG: hypothetical protein ACHRHE_10450 [Tepidisphaerales bacterium]
MRSQVIRILVVLVALSGVVVVGRTFRETDPFHHVGFGAWQETAQDRFSAMARRYVPLRPHLRGLEAVGWLTSYDHEMGHRMMAQSMLAPTLVIDSEAPEIVIASFETNAELDACLLTRSFQVQRRFGEGVAILKRRAR